MPTFFFIRSAVLAAFALVAAAGGAWAQPTGEFMTLDRGDHESRVGGFLGLLHIEDTDLDEAGLRLELFGQVVGQAGLGGYFALPLGGIIQNDFDDELALGAIEVGGLYARELALGQELVLRGGVTLPTASDDLVSASANFAGSVTRLTDLVQAVPKSSVLRLGGSWLGSLPGLLYRIDGGLDFPLFTTSDEGELDRSPLVRLNGAVGFGLGPGTLAFELVNLISTEDEGDLTASDRALTSAGVSLGLGVLGLRAQAGFFLLVDLLIEDDFNEGLFTFAVAASSAF